MHKLLGQPSNLEDDPKTIGFSQFESGNLENEAISVSQDTGVTGDRVPVPGTGSGTVPVVVRRILPLVELGS